MNKYIPWAAAGAGLIALIAALPKSAQGLKPVERFEHKNDVLADNQTGDLYAWMRLPDGSARFVKLDKTSEGAVRKGISSTPAPEPASQPAEDVRSGRMFEKQSTLKSGGNLYTINTQIKYRGKENAMLYRVAVNVAPPIDPKTRKPLACVTPAQSAALRSVYGAEGSSLKVRLEDTDKFWVKDVSVPLFAKQADNKATTIIDGIKDSCGRESGIVFHGIAQNLDLADYNWVEDGKLILGSVKFTGPAK